MPISSNELICVFGEKRSLQELYTLSIFLTKYQAKSCEVTSSHFSPIVNDDGLSNQRFSVPSSSG